MSTENIDVVINPPAGARQVVRSLDDIAASASNAATQVATLQRQLNGLGASNGLSQFQQQLMAVTTQLQGFQQQLQQVQNGVGRLASNGGGGIGSLTGMIRGLIGALSVKTIMEWTDAWISAEGKIRTLAPSLNDATAVMERLFQIAQTTRAPVDKLASLYHLMSISAKDLGASQADMLRVTETVGKLMAAQGTNATQARGALIQLAQTFGTGKVRAQEFNSLMQGLPLLLNTVAKHIDGAQGSTARLKQMLIDGKLSSKAFFDALLAASQDADIMFQKAPKTFAGAFTVMRNAIEQYLGKLNEASSATSTFYDICKGLADNIDNVARALGVVGAVLLALPLGPVGVAIAGLASYMAFFGEKTLVAHDGITSLSDVSNVVWEGMKSGMLGVQLKIQDFAQKYIPQLSSGFADLGNVTFMDLVKLCDQGFDKILQAGMGAAYGIKAVYEGLPDVMVNVGRDMYNGMVPWLEKLLNYSIDRLNELRNMVGMTMIPHINMERAKVEVNAFQKFGQDVSKAVASGVEAAGNPFEKSFNNIFSKARTLAAARASRVDSGDLPNTLGNRPPALGNTAKPDLKAAREEARNDLRALQEIFDRYKVDSDKLVEVERHKEVMLKASYDAGSINFRTYTQDLERMQDDSYQKQVELLNTTRAQLESQRDATYAALQRKGAKPQELDNFVKDFTTKVQALDNALSKLKDKQDETLATRMANKAKPINDFVQSMQKAIELDDLNLKQELEKIDAKKNLNQLDERSLYIQQEVIRLQGPYQDALQKVNSELAQLKEQGLFDVNDEVIQNRIQDLVTLGAKLQIKINEITKAVPDALGAAFDAGKVDAFSKELSKSLADALVEGGKDAGKNIRDILQKELIKKPFAMMIEAILRPIANVIGSVVNSAVNNMSSDFMGNMSSVFGGGGSNGSSSGGGLGGLFSMASGSWGNAAFDIGSSLNQNGFEGAGNFMMDNSEMLGGIGSGLGFLSAGLNAAKGKWGSAAGGAIGTFFGPIGTMVGSAIGGMIDSMFSGKGGPKDESGAGYAYAGKGTSSSVASGIIQGVNQQWKSVAQQFGLTARNLGLGAFVSADTKGTAQTQFDITSSALGYSRGGRLGNVENVGRDPEALKAEVEAETTRIILTALKQSNLSDKLKDAIGQIDMSSTADVLSEKLDRILIAKQVEDQMTGLGKSFEFVANMSVDAMNHMVEFGGGIQQFSAGLQAYLKNFFTPDEQRRQVAGQVAASIDKDLGWTLTADHVLAMSRASFRALVESLDMSTESGQAAYGAFMKVAGAVADLTQVSNNAADSVNSAAEAQQKLNQLRSDLSTAYQKEHDGLQSSIDAIVSWRDKLVDFQHGLTQGSNSYLTPEQKYNAAKGDYNFVTSQLMSSDPTQRAAGQARFETVAKDFLDASKVLNASGEQYKSDFNKVFADSQASIAQGDQQYNVQLDQLKALDRSVANLITINDSILSVRDAIAQLSGMPGASTNTVGTVNQLFQDLLGRSPDAGATTFWATQLQNGSTINDVANGIRNSPEYQNRASVVSVFNELLGRNPDAGGMQYWSNMLNNGVSMDAFRQGVMNSDEYKGLPGHAAGLSYVPRNNYLMRAHYGEAILNQTEANHWRWSQRSENFNMDPVTQSLANVHAELVDIRRQQEAATRAEIASNEAALERNAQLVGTRVSESSDRQSFKDRARARHGIR